VHGAIAKKSTLGGSKRQLPGVIWPQIGPTSTTKTTEIVIIGCIMKKESTRNFEINNLAGKNINEIGGCKKSLIPKF
jgi:hypothetical protein